jgi:hypothetical protein
VTVWLAAITALSLATLPTSANAASVEQSASIPWVLHVSINCTQPTRSVPTDVADIVFVNNTDLEGFNNYTLVNGLNLTNVSEVVIMGHPPSACLNASVQEVDVNVSAGGMFPVNLTFSPSNSSVITPLPLPLAAPGPIVPLFIQLVGVGVVVLALWFYVIALRRTTEVLDI